MMQQADCSNRLLSIMSTESFGLLVEYLEPVDFPLGTVLTEANQPIRHTYFLEEGVASLIASTSDGTKVEAGLIGREGFMVPAFALDADQLPHGSRIQVPGHGYRIERKAFVRTIEGRPPLFHLMLRFAQCLVVQTSYTALANAAYEVDVRLARWLLMIHDRSPSDDLLTTHHFMSFMLGVQRPSVTNALHILEGEGLIRTERGCVSIRNRAALERFAGAAYGVPENEYRRLIGPLS